MPTRVVVALAADGPVGMATKGVGAAHTRLVQSSPNRAAISVTIESIRIIFMAAII
ncbi:hypothetical protein GCM10009412_37790 [Aeromonas salmonicida subsp. achromogenes]|jgi:hypothetical protein